MTNTPRQSSLVEIEQPLNLSTSILQDLGEIGNVQNIQLYNPIYPLFFNLNESNWNNISLNQKYHIQSHNTVKEIIPNEEGKENIEISKKIFIKYSPLLDPVKYMIGKYDTNDPKIRSLPNITTTDQECHSKIVNPMNSSYVDNFFYYLSSVMKNKYGFIHGIDFYGSFLGIQDKFNFKVEDDLEYLADSSFFLSNIGKLMVLENVNKEQLISGEKGSGSRCNRTKVCIGECVNHDLLCIEDAILGFGESNSATCIDSLNELDIWNEPLCEIVYTNKKIKHIDSLSLNPDNDTYKSYDSNDDESRSENNESRSENNESRSENNERRSENNERRSENNESGSENNESGSDESGSDESGSDESGSDESGSESDESDESNWEDINEEPEPEPIAQIFNFPIQMICLEKCSETFDSLLESGELEHDKYASILFQVVIMLLVYQKVFNFTHNDLHTNNIMFVNTELEYLYYIVNGISYKVPTFGRIFKLIDFGRSIYKYNGHTFCSDSFAYGGDANSQYNCEPFMNNNKPRLLPNMSFDLCRLGCSIYDFLDEDESPKNEPFNTVSRWCNDDTGKSVLYKKNGRERYSGFRLYKMIARTVHNHTPEEQLNFPFFKQFVCNEIINPDTTVMDVDSYPCLI